MIRIRKSSSVLTRSPYASLISGVIFLGMLVAGMILALSLPCVAQSITPANNPHGPALDVQTEAAFFHFYNMEYDRSTQEFEKILEKHPGDPFAVNHLLTAILMRDLYDTG